MYNVYTDNINIMISVCEKVMWGLDTWTVYYQENLFINNGNTVMLIWALLLENHFGVWLLAVAYAPPQTSLFDFRLELFAWALPL